MPLIIDYLITKSIYFYSPSINRIYVYQGVDVERYYERMRRYYFSEASGFRWNKDLDSWSILSEDFVYYDRYRDRVYLRQFYFKEVSYVVGDFVQEEINKRVERKWR